MIVVDNLQHKSTMRGTVTQPIQIFLLAVLYCLRTWNCCSALSIIQHQSRIGFHFLRRDPSRKTSASITHYVRQTLTLSSSGYDTTLWDSNDRRSIIHNHGLRWWGVTNTIEDWPRMNSIVGDEINQNYTGQKQTRIASCGGGGSSCDMKQKSCFNCSQLLHSFALVAYCRRLSFLFLSMLMVNFVRSTILKASVGTHRHKCKENKIFASSFAYACMNVLFHSFILFSPKTVDAQER